MDKATADQREEIAIAFARGFRAGCNANVTDEIDLLRKLIKERDAYFAENPVVKDSLTVDPKPQGEAQVCPHNRDICWECMRMEQAARVPPEETNNLECAQSLVKHLYTKHWPEITGFKVLDDMQGVLSQLDNMTSGMVRKPAPPDRLLEAAKAVVENSTLGDCKSEWSMRLNTSISKVPSNLILDLEKAIEAHGKPSVAKWKDGEA